MGWFSKRPAERRIELDTCGEYDFGVVGESFYQDALSQLAGGKSQKSCWIETSATLEPEDDNEYDRNAVGVWISGMKVAHLSKSDAKAYRRTWGNATGSCPAVICGGWVAADDEGSFGVKLDWLGPV